MGSTPGPAPSGLVFALDIGTRSIIGVAGRMHEGLFHLEALEWMEHPKRAMIDGQIEDIAQVAHVAGVVKQRMEEKLGVTLTTVSVAAAGRALRTSHGTHAVELTPGTPVTAQKVYELELGAIENARKKLDTSADGLSYYCVGHSVTQYKIDNYPFTSVLGHRGALLETEVIATFLPAEVVDSLRSCMDALDLEIDTLTLEPIAAMRAVIPQDVRLLDLALVDIGAGTSDIALCSGGAVSGYTMATVAGDEITEAIIREYLVDFATAEGIKYALETGGEISYKDILGFKYTRPTSEIREAIRPSIEALAGIITDKICECSPKRPAAVFLVGGGSHTPGLASQLAARLNLEEKRVAAAGHNFSGRLVHEGSAASIEGPEFATPLGIALTAADNAANEGGIVSINGKRVRLFTAQVTGVIDALLVGGYRYDDLMGRNGKSLTITLNGQRHIIRGGFYTAAEIRVNGNPASLTSPVQHGDIIEVVPAVFGENAKATVADFTQNGSFTLTVNGKPYTAGVTALLNGSPAAPETALRDFDSLEITRIETLAELCADAGIPLEDTQFTVNGQPQTPGYILRPQDVLCYTDTNTLPAEEPGTQSAPSLPLFEDAAHAAASDKDTPPHEAAGPAPVAILQATSETPPADNPAPPEAAFVQQEAAPANTPPADIITENPATRSLRITLNGRTVVLPPKPEQTPHCLVDLLPLVDIDPAHPQGTVRLRINGREAAYIDEVMYDDTIEIGWNTPAS